LPAIGAEAANTKDCDPEMHAVAAAARRRSQILSIKIVETMPISHLHDPAKITAARRTRDQPSATSVADAARGDEAGGHRGVFDPNASTTGS
jgi:hypothetical protein